MSDIYSPVVITKSILEKYKPTRLYIKESNGLKYFGKSTKDNIHDYPGSGKFWIKHIKKHGKHTIKTIWISEWFTCPYKLQDYAIKFSKDNDIVHSEEWANLIAENGLSGGYNKNNYFSVSDFNRLPRTAEHKKAIGDAQRGKKETDIVRQKKSASHQTLESKRKARELMLGAKCWNNGLITVRSKTCPGDNWVTGRVRCHNGTKIKIDGIVFDSYKAARLHFKIGDNRIKQWIQTGIATLV